MKLNEVLSIIRSAPYGSEELLDAVDRALDLGVDDDLLDQLLNQKEKVFIPPPDTNKEQLEYWKRLAGKPNPNHATDVTSDIVAARRGGQRGSKGPQSIHKIPPRGGHRVELMVG